MVARQLRIQLKLDRVDDAVSLFEKNVIPLCRKKKGFRGAYFLADPKSGEGMIMTLWKDEQAMLATERSQFFLEQVSKFLGFYAKPPIRESFKVAVWNPKKS